MIVRILSWSSPVIVALGLIGLALTAIRDAKREDARPAEGSFWRAIDRSDRPLEIQGPGLRLKPRDRLALAVRDEGGVALDRLEVGFGFDRVEGALDVVLDSASRRIVVRLAPPSTFGVLVAEQAPDETLKPLANFRDPTPLAAAGASVAVELSFEGGALGIRIGAHPILKVDGIENRFEDVELRSIGATVLLSTVAVEGRRGTDASDPGEALVWREDFTSLPPIGALAAAGDALRGALLALCFLGLVLRALCLTRPPLRSLTLAILDAAAPDALVFCCALVASPSRSPLVHAALLSIGIALGLIRLRRFLPAATVTADALRALPIAFAAIAFAAFTFGRHSAVIEGPVLAAERLAIARPQAAMQSRPAPVRLDAANEIVHEGMLRNLDLTAKVTLRSDSILHVRLRVRQTRSPEGISLFLSTDPRFASGFRLETRGEFAAVGPPAPQLAPEVEHDLRIEARGREFRAIVDGSDFATGASALFGEGSIQWLAAHGSGAVRDIVVAPVAVPESPPSAASIERLEWLRIALFALALAALTALALRIPLLRAIECVALGVAPVTLAFNLAGAGTTPPLVLLAAGALLSIVVLLLPTMAHARRLSGWRTALFPGVIALVMVGAFRLKALAEPPPHAMDDDQVAKLAITHWSGDRLEDELLWLTHPIFRRWNLYLANHLLRNKRHAVEKPKGTQRVLCVGTSSTYGEEATIAYPERVESMLKSEGRVVEVLNCGVRGSSGDRLYRILRDQLLVFSPDVVTLSLLHNDSFALSQSDDEAYLAEITAPGARRSPLADFAKDRDIGAGAATLERYVELFALDSRHADLPRGDDSPPHRFERMLRRFVALAHERGFRLVFIKEPVRGDEPRLWKIEFYDAMDRVGKEHGIPVVDPSPLMQQRGGAALFADTIHPLDVGHQVVADSLVPSLRAQLDAR